MTMVITTTIKETHVKDQRFKSYQNLLVCEVIKFEYKRICNPSTGNRKKR